MVDHDPSEERAVYFYEMLAILGWSKSKYYSYNRQTRKRWCDELKEVGVVMMKWEKEPGKWPKLRIKAFPKKIKEWMVFKASKGERV